MSRKLLPLPLGDHAPRGSAVRFWHQYRFRHRLESLATVGGLVLAAAGAGLGLPSERLAVHVDSSGYHLGGTLLARVAEGRYAGNLALATRREGSHTFGAAAGVLAGKPLQGRCVVLPGSNAEDCEFVLDRRHFLAHDVRGRRGWQRRYDDGTKVDIDLGDPANPVPVPVPLGHH